MDAAPNLGVDFGEVCVETGDVRGTPQIEVLPHIASSAPQIDRSCRKSDNPGDVRRGGVDVRRKVPLFDQAEAGRGDGALDLGKVDDELGAVRRKDELAEQDGLAVGVIGDSLAAQHR